MTEVDEETRGFLDRLLRESVDGRRLVEQKLDTLDQKVDAMNDRMLTNFDALYKRDEDRQIEYQAIKAALSRVEVAIAHLQSSLSRLEQDFREQRISMLQLHEEIREIRARLVDLEARVAQLETMARGDHDA